MKRLLLPIVASVLSVAVNAQSTPDGVGQEQTSATTQTQNQRPKVALVLSGGGAKGMAHVGVIKVLEKAGIPVDIVTGTSMGSIVGGLYSVGWNSEAMEKRISSIDWSLMLSDKPAYYSQDLAERERRDTYMLSKTITASKEKNVAEVGGLLQGKNLELLFNTLYSGYTDSIDFNQLPRPFACVATDIVTNTEYDWHSGSLPTAIRSSMAIPVAFTPIRKGDMMLVDGGLRNNYPVDVARQMGADYVIGCMVQGKGRTADELDTGTALLGQLIDVNCKNKYDDNVADTDLPIRIDVTGYGTLSFTAQAIDSLMARGEQAALSHWDELMELKKKLGLAEDYKPEMLYPREEATQEPDYSVAQTRTVSAPTMTGSLGMRFDTEEIVAAQLSGLYRPKNSPFELEAVARLGKRIGGNLSGAWLLSDKGSRLGLGYQFRHNDIDVYYMGDKSLQTEYNHHQVALSIAGMNLRNVYVDMGARFDYYDYEDVFIAPHLAEQSMGQIDDEHYFSYFLNFRYSSERDAFFPERGARFVARYAYHTDNMIEMNDHEGVSEVSGNWRWSLPVNSRLTIQPALYGRMLFGKDYSIVHNNVVGGPWFGHYLEQQLPFAGVGHVQLVDKQFVAAQLQLQERLTTNNYVTLRGAYARHTDKLSDMFDHSAYWGVEMAYYYRTKLGPVGGSLGYSNMTDKVNVFFNLGFEF